VKRLLFLVIVAVVGTGVLLSLGKWQLDRLVWKRAILNEIETRIQDAPIPLAATLDPVADEYQAINISGDLTPDYVRVLGGLKNIGAVHKIITVLDAGGRRILVDLGYVKIDDAVQLNLSGPVQILGNLHWPEETDSYTPAPDLAANLWFARDVDKLAAHLNAEPILIVAKELMPQIDGLTPLPVDTAGIPNDHLNYAITWFSLAAVWAAMSALFFWRTRQKVSEK